jgi:hypothetical protein
MGSLARKCIGTTLCLVGLGFLVVFLRVFWRVGLWEALDGAKGGVYCWVLTGTILLPFTVGVALLWEVRSWRPFVGWWLVYLGVLVFGSLLFFVRDYRIWPDIIVCGSIFGLPPIVCGVLLLVRANGDKALQMPMGSRRRENDG